MATITVSQLSIQEQLPANRVTVTAKAQVSFTSYEVFQMQHGVRFRLDCAVMGDDLGVGSIIYNFASKYFPDSTPTQVETVVFTVELPSNRLNEDPLPNDADEIFANFTLRNLETGVVITRRSNQIVHHFE